MSVSKFTRCSLSLILVFMLNNVFGQNKHVLNLPKYDKQVVHFGFLIGLNNSYFKVQRSDDFRILDTVYTVIPRGVTGLNLGIISNLKLNRYFDLRFTPSLSFSQRNLEYELKYAVNESEIITKTIESTYLDFPFDVKFKSKRVDNFRMYVLGGVKWGIDMVSQAKVLAKDKEIVKLKSNDFGYSIGLGFDFYLTYFKFAPEIKMYNGLNNLLVQDNRTLTRPLEGLYSKTFLISFTFE